MATLLLRSAGAAVGTLLGGPLGGLIGGAVGAVGGAVVDSLLINALTPRKETPQLDALPITASNEGAAVRKLWGRMRLGGNVIWTTQFQSYDSTDDTGSGKGFGASKAKTTHYQLSFAVAFCEGGDNLSLGRVWADGNEIDLNQYPHAFYTGSESQLPDSFMESIEGTGNVPAYRGTCYLVFYLMVLDAFGARMPQITAELHRAAPIPDPDDAANLLRAVALLPGAGEFVLGTNLYQSTDGEGSWFPENVHSVGGAADLYESLAQLRAALPNKAAASLVVTWFGTDLRAGQCRVVPKVETAFKTVTPTDWSVNGLTRTEAEVVSLIDPAILDPTGLVDAAPPTGFVPAFGGTPSDSTVVEAIAALHGEGLQVMFYPFVMMDVPPGNALPDPYGGSEQAAFPWRGRLTCSVAPGRPGSPDGTPAVADEVAAFFTQFSVMVLHYAQLCVEAGGVEAFVIGSELVGLTRLRAGPGDAAYPAVAALKDLAAQVRAIVGPGCKIGYAADWSEYHSHRPDDGTHDVVFNMDPLWSDPNIDFIGIDNYLPVSDWRDGEPNIDADPVAGPFTIYDRDYLKANIEGGEYFDWYYASDADRVAQTRTPIRDTTQGRHWVFRQKDIRSWWANPHHSRPGGVENAAATAFVPHGKPLWFTEFGCPAVDKGTNQPNVFYDPKSAESSLPYFSIGSKDDPVQRAYLEAMLAYWRDNAPVSSVYGGPMVEPSTMFAWAWDARPYPEFPGQTAVWHDTPNYELGHWLTGRIDEVPLRWIVAELCKAVGVTAFDCTALKSASTLVLGFATNAISSPRDILAGLMDAYGFDACESQGRLVFFSKGNVRGASIGLDGLVIEGDADPGYALTRAADTDLPGAVRLTYADPFRSYSSAAVEARKAVGNSQNVAALSSAATLDRTYASDMASSLLQQAWAARDTGAIKVPPSLLRLDAGDAVTLTLEGPALSFRVRSVATTTCRTLDLVGFDPSLLKVGSRPEAPPTSPRPSALGPPLIEFMDLPLLTGTEATPWAPRVAAYSAPWAGVDLYRDEGGGGFTYLASVGSAATFGELTGPLYSGPVDRWDQGNILSLKLYGGATLLSLSEAAVLGGAGALCVKSPSGAWEVLQYQDAALTGAGRYNLTRLLRGQLGTEAAMADPVPAGARVVVLDPARMPLLPMGVDRRGLSQTLRYGPSPYPASDARYRTVNLAFAGVGLRPYSVAGVEARRLRPGADVLVSWARRTRFAGDGWDPDSVPLNEEAELYDLEVLDPGGDVVRTMSGLTAPSWLYAAADQAADFGAPQTAYTLRLFQLSALFGRGQAAKTTVYP